MQNLTVCKNELCAEWLSKKYNKLKRMDTSQRQDKGNALSSFVSEYIIFIRRVIIAMFSVSSMDNNMWILFIMIMFILFDAGNRMESILLLCIIFVIVLQFELYLNELFKQILWSFLSYFHLYLLFSYFIL